MTVWVCWGLFAVAWLAGAIYNARCAPAVRERSACIAPRLIGFAAVLVLTQLVPARIWRPNTVDTPWLAAPGVTLLAVCTGGMDPVGFGLAQLAAVVGA